MKLAEFSVNRRVTVTIVTFLIIVLGVVAYFKLGLEMMPDMEYPVVSIITIYPGAAPEDIEKTITKPLETALAGVKHIKSLKSSSKETYSIIQVEFEWGTNTDFAAQDLRDAIDMISDRLPDDAKKPMVVKFNMSQMPILMFGVTGAKNTYELRKILDNDVSPDLKHLNGVASIMVVGGKEAEKQIIVDKFKLQSLNLSIDRVVNILRAQNLNLPAGYLQEFQKDYLLRTIGEYKSIDEIKNTPVSMTKTGKIIYIKDFATVKNGFKEQRYKIRTNKKPTAMIMVSKESGANTLDVTRAVKKEIKKLEKRVPGHIRFHKIMDMGNIVELVTSDTANNAIVGGLLAIFMMFLFLKNWRPTLAISLAIPISLITTFIPIYLMGYSLNIMTLGGLALGVGMLVDNAVVVIENIYRHLELGEDRITAAKLGASEVGMAITASTLTTVAVFLPMAFGGGIAGQLVRGLALTVSFALFSSLFVSLTLVPMIASILFKKRNRSKKNEDGLIFGFVRKSYLSILKKSLAHRFLTLFLVFLLFVGSLLLIPKIGAEFMPAQDMPIQILKITMPTGTKLDATNNVVKQVENIVGKIKEVETYLVDIGSMDNGMAKQDPTSPTGVNEATVFIRLLNKKDRVRSSTEIMSEIRSKLPKLKGVEIKVFDMSSQSMGNGETDPVAIKIYGKDLDKLIDIENQISRTIKGVKGITDVTKSLKKSTPEKHIIIDRDRAFHYGLTLAQIASAIRTSTLGSVAGKFRKSGEEIDLRVRLKKNERENLSDITHLSIKSPLGFSVPLSQVAKVVNGTGPRSIEREHQVRKATVTANVEGRDLGRTVKDVKQALKTVEKNLPEGYFLEYGGTYKQMTESFITLLEALLLAILLVYTVMASQFESFTHPFVVMFTMPLAFIGVILISFLTGTTLSVPSFVGIIILAGIVVNNGIVLIDRANQLIRIEKKPQFQALIEAGSDRLRPVLITAGTTIIGMIPMAISKSQGASMKAPMAIAVIGGLTASTFFTLVIIPVIYSIISHISTKTQQKTMKILHGEEK